MRVLERKVARQLQVQRHLGAAFDVEHVDVVDLAHARDAERRGLRAVADARRLLRLDVHDDVAARQRRSTASSTLSAAAWPWPTAAPGRDADHDVRELASAGLAHPQPLEVDDRADVGDRRARRRLGLDRHAVHEHVDVRPHQPRGGGEHEHRDEQRGDRVGVLVAGANEQQADEHGGRPEQVAEEMERVRLERRAVEASRAARHETIVRLASIAITTPTTTSAYHVASTWTSDDARQPLDRAQGDEHAGEHEDRRLAERREVLRLAVAVLVPLVGGPRRDADGEEREQRRDEIRPRVKRLGEEPEAVRREPGRELDRDQHDRGEHGHERGAALRAHGEA